MMAILGACIGSTSAAIRGLIVRAVPGSETGSATGFYQVVRYPGSSLGSALTASILASHTPPRQPLPARSGYTLVFSAGVAICAAAAALAWYLPTRRRAPDPSQDQPDDEQLAEEDAELGPTGITLSERH